MIIDFDWSSKFAGTLVDSSYLAGESFVYRTRCAWKLLIEVRFIFGPKYPVSIIVLICFGSWFSLLIINRVVLRKLSCILGDLLFW